MNIKRIFGCIGLGIAASVGGTMQAKVLALRAVAPNVEVESKDEVNDTCIYALAVELQRAGITTQDVAEGADAEMAASFVVTPKENWPFGNDARTNYSIAVKSLPGLHLIYADQGRTKGNNAARACGRLAKTIVKKFLAAGGLK